MTSKGKGNSIEEIIAENHLGGLYATRAKIEERYASRMEEYQDVEEAVQKLRDDPPEGLAGLDLETDEGKQKAADLIGVEVQRFTEYLSLGQEKHEEIKDAIGLDALKEKGQNALSSVATEVTAENFPNEPSFMVYYTAEWCAPCAWVKPTIAALAPHLDVPLYFSEDSELRKAEEITSIPRLVLYTEEGKVHSYPWAAESAAELWESMNGLLSVSKSYEGVGLFQCTDGVCEVIEYDPKKH